MFKNVIVGIDGRSGGRDAVALGRRLLDPLGRLTLVHVHLETTAVIVHEFDSAARDEDRRLLEREREAAGGEVEVVGIGATSVAVGLHRYAEDHVADLLVVGTCHRGVVGRVLAGDDTRDSLRCAPCAVAVSPPGYEEVPAPIEVIGVGYDASPESQAALETARELVRAGGAEIHVLIVVAAVRFDGTRLPPMNGVMGTDLPLDDMRRRLDELEYVTARPAFGIPVEELGTFGDEVDLLLLGSPSEGAECLVVANRVSKHLARAGRFPLLVVPSAPMRRDPAVAGKAQGESPPGFEKP